jgi:hypothetical protein
MKAAGAVSLQNGVWVLPHTKEHEQIVDNLLSHLQEQGAVGQYFAATTLSDQAENELLDRFRALRNEEYAELIERCQSLLSELEKETKKKKFTFAELEENEDELHKLQNWFTRIQSRDLIGGGRAEEAANSIKSCTKAMEVFAERVYAQEQIDPKANLSK